MTSSTPRIITNAARKTGFTLTELLVVIAIIGALVAMVIPAFNGINRGGDITKAGYDVSGVLQTARSYATANDTYVWVGFFEENIASSGTGIGKIIISTVASADGTMVYNPGGVTTMSAGLTQLDKLLKISNMHLKTAVANDPVFPIGSGTGTSFDARPVVVGGTNAQIGDIPSETGLAQYLFQYPLGGTFQYKFKKVIQFNPRGETNVIVNNVVYPLTPIVEVGLQSTHGNVVDNAAKNVSAVQITGVGGNVAIYRR